MVQKYYFFRTSSIFSYLCSMKLSRIYPLLALLALLATGCHKEQAINPRLRAHVDGLNKEAFLNRYRNPELCINLSDTAIAFIADSLPIYDDGVLRALNNKAFAYFQTTRYPEALALVEQIEQGAQKTRSANADIEMVIARLLKARLLQRSGNIADSYRLLYDIDRSNILDHNHDNLLYNYAQTEYYITSLVLNYHYRDDSQADIRTLLEEVEDNHERLEVDYAQEMALNYALAYGWQTAGESLTALDYCYENLRLLDLPDVFCNYQYANTLQMMAMALKSIPGAVAPDSVLALYDEARERFFEYGDPYQMLGGVTSTARYALLIGDTARAHEVLSDWRTRRGTWKPFAAPKMELGYFDVLLRSRMASSPDEARSWYEHHSELQDYMTAAGRADFELQLTLEAATRSSHWKTVFIITLAAVAAILALLLALLWINALRLRREKRQLEEANRRDVERIANVETALSVMRHDISPFVGYLANPELPAEVRGEVVDQLVRTFDNIKQWTSLSIPKGLAFTPSMFPLQDVFDELSPQLLTPAVGVVVRFEPTPLSLWGDRALVVILLRNLIGNALKHTTQGSVVTRAETADGNMVHITVTDTGCGMSAEQQESLFRADRQLPPGSEHGFGLILCRYIVRRHDDLTRRGCRIWVESTPGAGTVMHCLLAAASDDKKRRLSVKGEARN